jgi:hypothetical protein
MTIPCRSLFALSALTLAALILPVCADAQGGTYYGLLAADVDTDEFPDHLYLYYLASNDVNNLSTIPPA